MTIVAPCFPHPPVYYARVKHSPPGPITPTEHPAPIMLIAHPEHPAPIMLIE
ncbi:hypothetical protein [Rathayibacter sp. VKM Ac-2928]|uniref:hypothetical protein n=1 Tax=Rathayibacter sp. VKM Ac-2928 TaxID=2929479 RepID=UPI001FB1CA61|nr:hypothetical protein [Rathayibacter sp. VKM Ac-2928]MCJ1683415.1 hypothetical protein [Rathayibacter sp. VKM Ac-2928]